MPQDVWDDLIKSNPHYATQTMSTTDLAVNRLATNAQTLTSGNNEADLARMKADLNILFGIKHSQLGINPSKNQLYQKPYPNAFDLVSYPTVWRVPDFVYIQWVMKTKPDLARGKGTFDQWRSRR